MNARRPYMRSMNGWWRRDPFFVRYMIREATAVIVAAYALVLLDGVLCLARGEAAWNGWLAQMRHPVSIVLHVLMLAVMIYHSYSWFEIMPKTLPPMFFGAKRVTAKAITMTGLLAAVATATATFAVAWMLRP